MATGTITNPNKTSLVMFDQYNSARYSAKVVTINFARAGRQMTNGTEYLIGTLPEEARPSSALYFDVVCRNQYRFQLHVNSEGKFYALPFQDVPDAWLYMPITFVI